MAPLTAEPSAPTAYPLQPVSGEPAPTPWLWIGTWSLGGEGFGPQDARESRKVLEQAFAGGVRHFDTAGLYAHGRSEALVAKAFRGRRREVFLSSKGGLEWSGSRVLHRGRPADLRRHLETSLRRLNSDYLDLFQLHWPDPAVPIGESLGALRDLRREGLIRHWGCGNLTAKEVKRHIPAGADVPHQVHFNPIHRTDAVLETGAQRRHCLNCAVSPLEQGLLGNGAAATGLAALGKRDLRRRNPCFQDPAVLAWVKKFGELAAAGALPRVPLVLAWILAHPNVHVVIPGPRNTRQLAEVLAHRSWMSRLGLTPSPGKPGAPGKGIPAEGHGHALWMHLEAGAARNDWKNT